MLANLFGVRADLVDGALHFLLGGTQLFAPVAQYARVVDVDLFHTSGSAIGIPRL